MISYLHHHKIRFFSSCNKSYLEEYFKFLCMVGRWSLTGVVHWRFFSKFFSSLIMWETLLYLTSSIISHFETAVILTSAANLVTNSDALSACNSFSDSYENKCEVPGGNWYFVEPEIKCIDWTLPMLLYFTC